MKVSCPSCSSVLNIDDKKVPPGGARIKCPTCQNVFPVKPAAASASPSGLVPLPGAGGEPPAAPGSQSWEQQPTRAMPGSNGIPGATTTAAPPTNVKLPGKAAKAQWEEVATRAVDSATALTAVAGSSAASATAVTSAVPLPGAPPPLPKAKASGPRAPKAAATTATVPLPGIGPKITEAPRVPREAQSPELTFTGDLGSVALPGAEATTIGPIGRVDPRAELSLGDDDRFGAVPLPGQALGLSDEATGAVPLPGADFSAGGDFEADVSSMPRSSVSASGFAISGPSGEVSLPGAAAPDPANFSYGGEVELPGAEAAPSSDFGFDPPPEPASGFDFGSVPPAPAPEAFSFDAPQHPPAFEAPPPAPAGAFDFDAAPPPPAPAPAAFSFDAPPPAAPSFSFDAPPAATGFDIEAQPPPPAAPAFDFSAPPPAPAAQVGFGEVDFGAGGDLEFDPTGGAANAAPAPRPSAAKADELEADLSAPLPPSGPQGPADGLEMLSFIDRSAQEAGAKADQSPAQRRFHVKRRSGKVFGPFEEQVVVKMLEDGQLLGNEEVSLDSENWTPIGTEPAFQSVMAKMMEAPSRSATATSLPQVDEAPKGPSMDRLKQLYEGRMAAVALVETRAPVPFKKRLPYIVGGAGLAAVLAVGIVLGTATPYGFFALKLLFPAKVRSDTREFGYLQEARKGFQDDTWKSYRLAKEQAEQALQIKEFPEARAVWAQSVYYLDRGFSKADEADLQRAKDEVVNIELLGEKHIEVLKTKASAALSAKDPDTALPLLGEAVAREEGDLEALFLRAEAYLLKKESGQAKQEYETILRKEPKSAKALHALGLIHRQANETDEAVKRFEEALAAAPTHVASAIELAEIAVLVKNDLETGRAALVSALSETNRPLLSPGQLSKALALRAQILVIEGKLNEAAPVFDEALKADPKSAFANGYAAHVFAELNQPEKAVSLYQVAFKTQPESLDFTEGYLSALILLGKMDEATQVLASANTRFPGNAMLSYLSARVADKLDNNKEAEEAYKRAIAADATIVDAYLFLSRYYMRFRRYGEAKPVLEAALEKAPDNAALRVGMGELALHERESEKAEEEFTRALKLNPYSAEAHLGASKIALEQGKLEVAEVEINKALSLNARLPGGRLQKGVTLWRLKRFDDAITELEEARREEPKNTQVIVTLGAVKFDKGDLTGALENLGTALVAEPAHPDGNFYLARVKNAKSEHTQALEAMKRALDYDAKNPLYIYWYGRLLVDARRVDDAIMEFKKAAEIDPTYADPLESLGTIAGNRNEFKPAVAYFRQVLELDPKRVEVHAKIGDALMKLEDWDGAIASYQRALEQAPELKGTYSKLGQAYQEKGQLPKAVEWFRQAVESQKDDADSWLSLGYLLKESKRPPEAIEAFTAYLELRPDAKNAREVGDEIHYLQQNTGRRRGP